MQNPSKQFATPREFAKISGLALHHVRQLIHARKIPFLQVGSRALIDVPAALEVLSVLAHENAQTQREGGRAK